MKLKEFFDYVESLDTRCNEILGLANREYASEDNKFYNFEVIASLMSQGGRKITPHDVASIYMLKHMFSIVRGVSKRETMEGRYIDAINYLKLMAGMSQTEKVDEDWGRLKEFGVDRLVNSLQDNADEEQFTP